MPRVTSRGPGTGPGAGSRKAGAAKKPVGGETRRKARPGAKATKAVETGGRKARTPSARDRSWGTSAEAPEEIGAAAGARKTRRTR